MSRTPLNPRGSGPMEDHERDAMIDSLRCSREEPPEYVAPGAEQKWRARNLVDIHWKLTGIEPPSESYCRIMACIIDHANPGDGNCFPRQTTIALETGYSKDTVKRAIKWWIKLKFLTTESRGLAKALAYHPQWDLFESFYVAVSEDIAAQKECLRDNSRGASRGTTRGAFTTDEVHHAAPHNLKDITSKEEPHPERVLSPSAKGTPVSEGQLRGKEEGQQRGEVESLSTNSQPPAKPNVITFRSLNREKLDAAAATVEADLSAHPSYGALLGWPELESHLGDAAAAELNARGSGAKLILARFAERKTGT